MQFQFDAEAKLKAVEREITYRVRVFDRRVHEKKMSREKADYEIAVMRAIADDYREAAQKTRLV